MATIVVSCLGDGRNTFCDQLTGHFRAHFRRPTEVMILSATVGSDAAIASALQALTSDSVLVEVLSGDHDEDDTIPFRARARARELFVPIITVQPAHSTSVAIASRLTKGTELFTVDLANPQSINLLIGRIRSLSSRRAVPLTLAEMRAARQRTPSLANTSLESRAAEPASSGSGFGGPVATMSHSERHLPSRRPTEATPAGPSYDHVSSRSELPRALRPSWRSAAPWLLAAGIGAGVAWFFRHDIASSATAIVKLLHSMSPGVPSALPVSSVLEASAFGPKSIKPGGEGLLQIFLHGLDQSEAATAFAMAADPDTSRRAITTLVTEVPIGQRIDVVLEAPGLVIEQPSQFLVWRGQARACQFEVVVPEQHALGDVTLRATISCGGVPVGWLRFKLRIERTGPIAKNEMQGVGSHRYKRAFLSYSSADRAEVLKRAQSLKAARIEFFQDLLTLEPGDRWEQRLYDEIDRCDLFLLFWSTSAAQSKWVIGEAEHALTRQRVRDGEPDIVPIILEGPPVPRPPDSLNMIHFNDSLRYVIAAVEAERRP
jgi:hypothetical protein